MSLSDKLKRAAAEHKKRIKSDPAYAEAERLAKENRHKVMAAWVERIDAMNAELTGGSIDGYVVLQDVASELEVNVFDLERIPARQFDSHVRAIIWRRKRDEAKQQGRYTHPIFALSDELKQRESERGNWKRPAIAKEFIRRMSGSQLKEEQAKHGDGDELVAYYVNQLRNHKDKLLYP